MTRMQERYVKEVAPALMKKFNYKSVMQIPKLEKIVVNVGCGEARDNQKMMDAIVNDLTIITGLMMGIIIRYMLRGRVIDGEQLTIVILGVILQLILPIM